MPAAALGQHIAGRRKRANDRRRASVKLAAQYPGPATMTAPRKACPEPRRRAVALISGGLDSMLAAKLIKDQGVHVEGINFFTGFCVEGHTHAIRRDHRDKPKRNNALWSAEQIGIKLHIVDVIEDSMCLPGCP
jgi:hypothetical protein